ncbi:FAD binding domain-containing protein [Clohesyomyces aquaticus]|uniref:FAD binding domain-containing protein n=1 Tax=Clohesyomyces aquaticus TaxID=1231657 RepID=A0A1Y1YXZ4_9PLEO|nr:FAD binding domain-containing protein [Clohesyomyces aquaticus]
MKATNIASAIFTLMYVVEAVRWSSGRQTLVRSQAMFDFEKDHLTEQELAAVHSEKRQPNVPKKCKTYPTDPDWPSEQQWEDLDSRLDGALIKSIPEASICYRNGSAIESAQCQSLTDTWNNSTLRISDATSIRSILFQGMTCMPPAYSAAFLGNKKGCELGGFPEYVVNATSVKQIQVAVLFAKEHNIRLVIKNTGHDFGAKSVGKGALSIWTHHLKDSEYIERYTGEGYNGKAVRLAAGIEVYEAYALAKKHGITLVGGEGKTVGYIGGYIQGGGHSPLTSIWGMAADHVLAIQVVTADGSFITASPSNNTDLFWAIRGGGGSTYGVVSSMVIKAFPQIKVTTMRFNMTTGANFTKEKFWEAQRAYVDNFAYYADLGYYAYYRIRHVNGEIFHDMTSWVAPNTSEVDFRVSLAPLFAKWKALGVPFDPIIQEYDNFSDGWADGFPQEAWSWTMRQASRFFPRENLVNETNRAVSFDAIQGVFDEGANLIMFNFRNPPGSDTIDNAVNPAWRDVLMFALMFVTWNPANSTEYVTQLSRNLTYEWNPRWKKLTRGSGTYMSESDYIEPGWQQSFHGHKYQRLYAIKQKWDPDSVFYAQNAVGSEDWEMREMILGHLPSQNSRLCRT